MGGAVWERLETMGPCFPQPGGTSTDQASLLVLSRSQATQQTAGPGGKRNQGLFMGPQRLIPVEVGLGSSVPGFGSTAHGLQKGK